MDWKENLRARLKENIDRLTHLSDAQRADLLEREMAKAVGATETGQPLNATLPSTTTTPQ